MPPRLMCLNIVTFDLKGLKVDRLSAPMNMPMPVNEYTLSSLKGFARRDCDATKPSSALERGSYCYLHPPKGCSGARQKNMERIWSQRSQTLSLSSNCEAWSFV